MTIAPANPTRPIHSALLNKLNALQTFTSPWRVMFIAAVFAIPALLGGYIQDDNYFILRYFFPAQTNQISIPSLSPYGMFTLSDGSAEQVQQLVNSALAPWWIDPHFKFSLFRPLAEWSHALDFWLWPRETLLVHLHSLVWFLALVYGATRFFQLTLGNTPVAGLAALLFALDSNLGWVNGWIASRNTLMCLALGVNAINLFIAALGGNRIKLAGGLALFSAALFSGEFALSSYA
ncbi:MAG TPA: hypothetical protein VFM46_18850, partial [Pseudomonadales bacterium]|nr:hypothetical protein [Pseudomonadales bacterium]